MRRSINFSCTAASGADEMKAKQNKKNNKRAGRYKGGKEGVADCREVHEKWRKQKAKLGKYLEGIKLGREGVNHAADGGD